VCLCVGGGGGRVDWNEIESIEIRLVSFCAFLFFFLVVCNISKIVLSHCGGT
jgi:hypothetical protein